MNVVYNKLKQENNELEYYMLDKKYCNYIGYKIDWKKYQDNGRKELLREAYANDLLDELLEILNINDDFSLESSLDEKDIMENFFRKMINTFDIKMLAQSNLYVFIIAVACEDEKMINYFFSPLAWNTSNTSTSKTKASFGPMNTPAPRSP